MTIQSAIQTIKACDRWLANVLYENETCFVWANPGKSFYEVYEHQVTHSVRVASVGKSLGLNRAMAEADRRNP